MAATPGNAATGPLGAGTSSSGTPEPCRLHPGGSPPDNQPGRQGPAGAIVLSGPGRGGYRRGAQWDPRTGARRRQRLVCARTMVFAHGFGCDQHMWRLVAPAFEDKFRTLVYDHIGAGASDLTAYDADR